MTTTEAGIQPTVFGDIYTVIGDTNGDGAWAVRVYFKPFVHLIWLGATVMVLGGFISLTDRKHRVGAPSRRKKTNSFGDSEPKATFKQA